MSIDYLIQNLLKENLINNDLVQTYKGASKFKSLIDSAKLLEKEQIIESFEDGGGKYGEEYYYQKLSQPKKPNYC
jgi:hypothetical protein